MEVTLTDMDRLAAEINEIDGTLSAIDWEVHCLEYEKFLDECWAYDSAEAEVHLF